MPALFISYRRTDSPDTVKLIQERLKRRLPRWEIFYDHESIPLGEQFPERLRAKVASATVVLVIIGPKWLKILQERKNAAVDHVRAEVRLALEAATSVVPVLVGHAAMPTGADLAEFADLQPLLQRNGCPVRPDPDFDGDLEPLIAHLKQLDSDEAIGATLADKYTLTGEIGHGGMGVVYRAEQKQPVKRTVAVKLIKPGMDSRDVLARFDAERQALAVMDHPNIAKVHDAGMTASGRPFFVMEYVKGVPITQYCDEKKLTPQERLNLFIPVCNAVQHAHKKGIIHRDLKPSNVLVEVVDGKPVPKVIDFGLAKALGQKLTDKTLYTDLDTRIGTLEYSAPEQAAGRSADVDARSDIYSLGVLLYELLTGAPPFTHEQLLKIGEEEMRRVIREDEPTKPSKKLSSSGELPAIAAKRHLESNKLTRLVRGDLDWIVMKCLEKERDRRYNNANDIGEELQRFLAKEPVQAGPPSTMYRLRKFLRSRKVGKLAVAGVVVGLLAAGLAIGLGVFMRPGRDREDTERAGSPQPIGPLEQRLQNAPEFPPDKLREKLLKSVVCIHVISDEIGGVHIVHSRGNGILVDRQERLVLTTDYVCNETCRYIFGLFPAYSDEGLIQNKEYYSSRVSNAPQAKFVRSDKKRHLALIQFEMLPENTAALKLATKEVHEGQTVFKLSGGDRGAIGQWGFRQGMVEQVANTEEFNKNATGSCRFIQTQLLTVPGDGGSPIVNSRCELVGVESFSNVKRPGSCMSVHVSEVREFLAAYRK